MTSLRIQSVQAKELDRSHWDTWAAIQSSRRELRSPYYHPRFAQLLAECGRDVRVAVIEEASGRVAGYFPYELEGSQLITAGGAVSDYHGAVLREGIAVSAEALLRSAHASWFRFNHMPVSQPTFDRYRVVDHVSPVANMEGGWSGYVARLSRLDGGRSPSVIKQMEKSQRRLVRDLGPLRFELHTKQPDVMARLREWKTAHRVRTHALKGDPFALPWFNQFLELALDDRPSAFFGSLCAMYAGDRLLSCHYGLQTQDTLHMWFASYDWEQRYYQPSMVMFLQLLQRVAEDGVTLVDFGRGEQPYKLRLCTDKVAMGEGVVSRPAWLGRSWSAGFLMTRAAKAALKQNPWVMRVWQGVSSGDGEQSAASE